MAFNTNNSFSLFTKPIGAGGGIQFWSLVTDDTIETVTGAGYFAKVTGFGAKTGDSVFCVSTTGATSFGVSLVSIDSAGTGTAVILEDIATQAQAEAGLSNTVLMTPLRGAQQLAALLPTTDVALDGGAHGETAQDLRYQLVRSVHSFKTAGQTIDDGVTDARAAILAGLQYCLTNKKVLFFPAGVYKLSAGISNTDLTLPAADVRSAPVGFGIKGEGPNQSLIYIPETNTTGGISIIFGTTNRFWGCVLHDFGIIIDNGASGVGVPKTFTPLIVRYTGNSAVEQFSHVDIQNVNIFGTALNNAVTSNRFVDVRGTFRPNAENYFFIACSDSTGNEWDDTSISFKAFRGIDVDDCYGPTIGKGQILSARTAISSAGSNSEGGRFEGATLSRCKTGLLWIRGASASQAITAITKANPGVVTYTGADPTNGDRVFITGEPDAVGMIEAMDREYTVAGVNAGANTFQLQSAIGTPVDVNTTNYTTYLTGATFRILPGTGAEAGPNVANCHIHARDFCIDANGSENGLIENNGILLGDSGHIVTITSASPAVVSQTAHGKIAGTPVRFTSTGALWTGLTIGTTYYVIAAGLTTDNYEVSAALGGAAVNTSGSQSGVHRAMYTLTTTHAIGIWLKNYVKPIITKNQVQVGNGNTNVGIYMDGSLSGANGNITNNQIGGTAGLYAIWIGDGDAGTTIKGGLFEGLEGSGVFTLHLKDDTTGEGGLHRYTPGGDANRQTEVIVGKDAGATAGPSLNWWRNSASPAADDLLTAHNFYGNDSAGNMTLFGAITGRADVVTDGGTEAGGLNFTARVANAEALAFSFGAGIGVSTATRMGTGTVNVTTGGGYYSNDVKVVGNQGALIADAAGGAIIDAEARTALNALLARLRTHGLIAT